MAVRIIKTFLFVVLALIAVSFAAEEEREKKEVVGLGLPGFYGGYGRVLPYTAGVGYPALPGYVAHPGLTYPGYRAFPGVVGHHGYYGGYPYLGGYGAYPYVP